MPSTVESLGRKLTATNQSMNSLINNNTGLKSKNTKLKKKMKSVEMMVGTVRSSLGLNNNPTVIQESFYEKYEFIAGLNMLQKPISSNIVFKI